MISAVRNRSLRSITFGAMLTTAAVAQQRNHPLGSATTGETAIPNASQVGRRSSYTQTSGILAELASPRVSVADSVPEKARHSSQTPPRPAELTNGGNQPLDSAKKSGSSIRSALLGLGSAVSVAAGYLIVALRSVPANMRNQHLATRAGAFLDFKEGFYPLNVSALRIMRTNNLALVLTGAALALQGKQSLWGLSFFALALCGASTVLPLAKRYGPQKPVHSFVKWCERCSIASISLFVLSLSPVGDWAAANVGVSPFLLGGASALVARGLSLLPMAHDLFKEARNPHRDRGFPGLKAPFMWTVGTALSAAAVDFSLSTATMVPMGALVQNVALSLFAAACYLRWRGTIGTKA